MKNSLIQTTTETRSILDGTRTMFVTVVEPQPVEGEDRMPEPDGYPWKAPYQPGQKVYVREKHKFIAYDGGYDNGVQQGGDHDYEIGLAVVEYEDGSTQAIDIYDEDMLKKTPIIGKWRSASTMPKWAARIWLEITVVRVKRIGEITEEEIESLGIYSMMEDDDTIISEAFNRAEHYAAGGAQLQYRPEKYGAIAYFDSLRNVTYEKNQWVFLHEFRRLNKHETKT